MFTEKIFRFIVRRNLRGSQESKNTHLELNENIINKSKLVDQMYIEESKSAIMFIERYDGKINFREKTVLDVGCGRGNLCFYMASNGAKKVTGMDIDEDYINYAKNKLVEDYIELNSKVDFVCVRHLDDLKSEKFDIVVSKDCFEHYEDPEAYIFSMKEKMRHDGKMVIGFSPLWKSPYGGHIDYLIKVPYIHLIFPESLITEELDWHFPERDNRNFGQGIHGLNKMTFRRFNKIIRDSGLIFEYIRTNDDYTNLPRILLFLTNIFKFIPFIGEYFTINVYCILRNP